jgi:hypothetical protein
MVFGIEMAWRSIRSERFEPRSKWNTTICVAVVSLLLLLTWMPTVVWPMYNRCFGSLIWFPMRYDLLTLSILCVLVFSCLLLAAIISIQLMRTSKMDHSERVSASRMTYYLLVVAVLYVSDIITCFGNTPNHCKTLVMPVEIQSLRRDFMDALSTARVAEISLFSTGLVITFFHLFLRTNATRMVIRPIEEMRAPKKQQRPRIRFFGPSDLEMNISGPMALQGGRGTSSSQGLIDVGPEKNHADFDPEYFQRPERVMTPNSGKPQSPIDPTKWPLPPPESAEVQITMPIEDRGKRGYSLFPTRADEVPRLPATVYDPNATTSESRVSKLAFRRLTRRGSITNVSEAFDFLTKPRPLFSEKHRRDHSTDSSATVQIGLRFSVAPATLAAAKCTRVDRNMDHLEHSKPSLKRGETESSGESIGLPIQVPSSGTTPEGAASPSLFPSPPTRVRVASPTRSPAFTMMPSQNSSAYLQAQREKVLPAIPPRSPVTHPATTAASIMSGLHMNPITPTKSEASPTSLNHRQAPSPTARIPLGAGTMSRSPPQSGWI